MPEINYAAFLPPLLTDAKQIKHLKIKSSSGIFRE